MASDGIRDEKTIGGCPYCEGYRAACVALESRLAEARARIREQDEVIIELEVDRDRGLKFIELTAGEREEARKERDQAKMELERLCPEWRALQTSNNPPA